MILETDSDPTAIYELMRSLALNHNTSIYAITNKARTRSPLPNAIKLIELQVDYGGSLIEQTIFTVKCYLEAKKLIKKSKRDIPHHMSPPPLWELLIL